MSYEAEILEVEGGSARRYRGSVRPLSYRIGRERDGVSLTLADVPRWIDIEEIRAPRDDVLEALYFGGFAPTPRAFARIGQTDPILGVAEKGTPITKLSREQRADYIANAIVILSASTFEKGADFSAPFAKLVGVADQFGIDIGIGTVIKAIERVSAQQVEGISDPIAAAKIAACLDRPTEDERSECLDQLFAEDQGVRMAGAENTAIKPWSAAAEGEEFGLLPKQITGTDGQVYVVTKIPGTDTVIGVKRWQVAAGVTAAGVATTAAAGATAFVIFGTKFGKKIRRKVKKFFK